MEKRERRRAAKRRVYHRLIQINCFIVLSFFAFNACKNQGNRAEDYENIKVEKLAGDSLATVFKIAVKDTVKTHRHLAHSETIYVIGGTAKMYMNDTSFVLKSGDVLFIPFKTWHSVKVTSEKPLQVLSIQSPGFDGSDREFLDEHKEMESAIESDY